MISMTGYGYSEMNYENAVISVEIKSVNSRFLDLSINLPPYLNAIESFFRNEITKIISRGKVDVFIRVKELESDAQIVADTIAKQIENRANFRTVQKQAIKNVMKAGAVGVKTAVSGRLGGAEMARTEGYTEGTVPLHTIRADIDYATATAPTTYGKIGVKVWIYKGEILPSKKKNGGDNNVNA